MHTMNDMDDIYESMSLINDQNIEFCFDPLDSDEFCCEPMICGNLEMKEWAGIQYSLNTNLRQL